MIVIFASKTTYCRLQIARKSGEQVSKRKRKRKIVTTAKNKKGVAFIFFYLIIFFLLSTQLEGEVRSSFGRLRLKIQRNNCAHIIYRFGGYNLLSLQI